MKIKKHLKNEYFKTIQKLASDYMLDELKRLKTLANGSNVPSILDDIENREIALTSAVADLVKFTLQKMK